MTVTLDTRQLAFLCAAAHRWLRTQSDTTRQDLERATDSGHLPVLSESEILHLANQLAQLRSLDRTISSHPGSFYRIHTTAQFHEPRARKGSRRRGSGGRPIAINLSEVNWDDASPVGAKPRSRLITIINFNRVSHHLDAIEVKLGRGYRDQLAVAPQCQAQLERYQRSDIDTAPFHTVTLDHRRYALFATPFSY